MRKCKICKTEFPITHQSRIYCGEKCRKESTRLRNLKSRKPVPKIRTSFPKFRCEHCKNLIQLTFDPRDNQMLLKTLVCDKCGKLAKL